MYSRGSYRENPGGIKDNVGQDKSMVSMKVMNYYMYI